MIRSIRLVNLRGFQDATLTLGPLSVVMGPNSAGKSTFGQALVLLAQLAKLNVAVPTLTRPPSISDAAWVADFGAEADARRKGSQEEVVISLESRAGPQHFGFGGIAGLGLELSSIRYGPPQGVEVTTTVEGARAPATEGARAPATSVPGDDRNGLDLKRIDQFLWKEGGKDANVTLFGLTVRNVMHLSGGSVYTAMPRQDQFLQLLDTIRYLKPNRADAARTYPYDPANRPAGVGPTGALTAQVLQDRGGQRLSMFQPPAQLPRTGEDAKNPAFTDWKEESKSLLEATTFWLKHLDLAQNIRTVVSTGAIELRASPPKDPSEHSIMDVGFGVSQVLPVIVQGLLMPAGSVFVVEQPESQLHPYPQAALADFFCALALGGVQTVVESHSLPFFERLRLRAALSAHQLGDKIRISFVDRCGPAGCASPKLVSLAEGEEVRWPEGFLHDPAGEEHALLLARLAARTEK